MAFISYVLKCLTEVDEISNWFDLSFGTIGVSILLMYAFNIIVGVLPLFNMLSREPAKIFARQDIE